VGNLNVLFPNGATGIGEGEYDLFNGIYTSYLDTGPYDPGTQQHGPYVFANSTIPTDTLNAPPGYKWFDYDPATPDIQWISYDNIAGKVSVKLISTTPAGTDGYWTNGTGSGMWSNAGNWDSNPNVPSLARDTARFVVKYPNGDPASPAIGTVNLNADSTVGKMYFDATAYTIMSPAGKTLTLDNGANPAEIHIADGSHEILAKVNLATNLTIWPATGTTLTLTDIDETPAGSGKGITVDDTGKVVLNGIGSFGGGITVNKGEVELGNFQSLAVGAPITIGAQGQVSLRVDMTVAGAAGAVQRAAVSAPSVNAVPEPGTLVLLAAGALIALAVGLRRKLGR
jgi:autotransporter-associated beta strand protein